MKKKPTCATVYNNTEWELSKIEREFRVLGRTVNKWRGRDITLYAHPSDAAELVSVGVTFDGRMKVVAVEDRTDWTTALEHSARGQVYVSE